MLSVDTNKISAEIKNLDKSIKNYSDNSYDIYNELAKLSSYWRDTNEVNFEEKLIKQKDNSLQILENLENISFFYKEVEEIYENK